MKTHLLALSILATFGCSTTTTQSVADDSSTPVVETVTRISRQEFARRFATIKEGMSADAVVAILGQPEDVRTQSDPGGIRLYRTSEIWGYGVDHHLGFPTLGTVAIDTNGKTQFMKGTTGANDLKGKLGEVELRRLLRLLADLGTIEGGGFRPEETIIAVNALQPLGKTVGVAVMREYLAVNFDRGSWGDDGVFAVMRLLFELRADKAPTTQESEEDWARVVHPSYFRAPGLGGADWFPDDPRTFPRFPVAMVDDIPLIIAGGYTISGVPETPEQHLDALEQGGAPWRKEPLHPADDPLAAIVKIESQLPRQQQEDGRLEFMMQVQILRLLKTVYRLPDDGDLDDYWDSDKAKAAFAKASREIRAMHVHWDAKRCCYARGDGTILPAVVKPLYRRSNFAPSFKTDHPFVMKLTLERVNSTRAELGFDIDTSHPLKAQPTGFRVVQLGHPEKVLAEEADLLKAADVNVSGSFSMAGSRGFDLPTGASVRIEATHGNEHLTSPVYRP